LQNQTEERQRARVEVNQSLNRRASLNGQTHGAMWVSAAIIAHQWAHLPDWLATVLVVAGFVLLYGLTVRRRWAYWVALPLDIAGVVGSVVLGAVRTGGPSGFVMLLAVFPLALTALVWTLRAAYLPLQRDNATHIGAR